MRKIVAGLLTGVVAMVLAVGLAAPAQAQTTGTAASSATATAYYAKAICNHQEGPYYGYIIDRDGIYGSGNYDGVLYPGVCTGYPPGTMGNLHYSHAAGYYLGSDHWCSSEYEYMGNLVWKYIRDLRGLAGGSYRWFTASVSGTKIYGVSQHAC
jgi:hypothetical protein